MPKEEKMPATAARAYDPDEGHEERILRLEDGYNELAKGLAVNTTKLEGVEVALGTGFKDVGEKIDLVMKPLADKIAGHIEDDEKLHAQVQSVDGRLKPIEDKRARAEARKAVLKKGGWALFLAFFGALIKHVVDHL